MKRLLYAILTVLLIAVQLLSFKSAAFAESDEPDGAGFDTVIPYVPQYKGELSEQSRVLLMDLETGNALIEQNGDVRAYPASTTKIMTAVLLIENTADDEWDTPLPPLAEVNSEASARGSQLGLKVGDCPTRRDLLYGLLLPSGCDCAYVVSNLIAGSEADFVFMMNVRASEIGMNNTGYENSYGLASNGHYTTAEDMATLVRHAMQYPLFRTVIATAYKTLTFNNNGSPRSISTKNTNHLIRPDLPDYYANAIGVKTGTATNADHCLTAAARKKGLELITIVLNSDSNAERYGFSKELLEWGFDYYASEGGLYSMNVTNALFKAGSDGCRVYDVPESGSEGTAKTAFAPGEGVRVGAYRYDSSNALWYMVWNGSGFDWAKSEELEFVAYINDILIRPGDALSGVSEEGSDPHIDGVIASRHLVKAVTVTVYDADGIPVTGGSNYPAASCTHTLYGTTVDQDVDLGILAPGVYTCVTRVEAVAFVPDAPDREYYITEEMSTVVIADKSGELEDKCTYSYNSNTGSNAPSGGAVNRGESFKVTDETPEKAGCKFVCWNTEPDGSGESYSAGDAVTVSTPVTLYAVWTLGEDAWEHSIECSANDGTLDIEGFIANGAGITKLMVRLTPDAADEPIFEYTLDRCTNRFDFNEISDQLADIELDGSEYVLRISGASALGELKQVFETKIVSSIASQFTLIFDPDGGSIVSGSDRMTLTAGATVSTLPTAEKSGYKFAGWFDEKGSEITAETAIEGYTTEEIVLKARWLSPEEDDSVVIIRPKTGVAAVPLWVWAAAGALVVAILIALIVIIIKKPDKTE